MHFDTLGGFVSAQSFGTVFCLPAPGQLSRGELCACSQADMVAVKETTLGAGPCTCWCRRMLTACHGWGDKIGPRNPLFGEEPLPLISIILAHSWSNHISWPKKAALDKLDWWISIQLSAINSNLPNPQWKVGGTSSGPSSQLGPAATENRSHKKRWPWPHAATRSVGSLALERISKRQRNIQTVSNSYKLVWQKCCEQEHDSNLGWTEKLWLAELWFKKDRQPRKNRPTRYPKCCFHISWHPYLVCLKMGHTPQTPILMGTLWQSIGIWGFQILRQTHVVWVWQRTFPHLSISDLSPICTIWWYYDRYRYSIV